MKDLLIGLDFGSDSVRAVLVSSTGKELKSCVHNYTRWNQGLYSDNSIAQFRQHPLDYLESLEEAMAEVLEMCDAIINDKAIECTALEGSKTVAVANACVMSAAKGGEPVIPPYIK